MIRDMDRLLLNGLPHRLYIRGIYKLVFRELRVFLGYQDMRQQVTNDIM